MWGAHDFSQSVFFAFLSFLFLLSEAVNFLYLRKFLLSKAALNLHLYFLTSPGVIDTVSMKHVQDYSLALWTIGLKGPMSSLMNSYTAEQGAYIQATYWELFRFHANQ